MGIYIEVNQIALSCGLGRSISIMSKVHKVKSIEKFTKVFPIHFTQSTFQSGSFSTFIDNIRTISKKVIKL